MIRRLILLSMICALVTLSVTGCQKAEKKETDASQADSNSAQAKKDEASESKTENASKTKADKTDADKTDPSTQKKMGGMGNMKMPTDPKSIQFKDAIDSNVEVPQGLDELVFIDTDGDRVALKDYIGKKNVVLVFTEGFNGMLCPFCKTQTSRLVSNYPKFQEQETEVLVVYPGARDHVDEFMKAAMGDDKSQVDAVPFPIVLDEDFSATKFFDIKSMHAHPSTFIIDKQGKICLAYVGADMTADRPSVKVILEKIQAANDR